jgi:hypothetical protein
VRIVERPVYSDALRDQNARRDGGTPADFAPAGPPPLHAHIARADSRETQPVSTHQPAAGPLKPTAVPCTHVGIGLAPRLGEIPSAISRTNRASANGPRPIQVTAVLLRGFRLDLLA